MLDSTSKTTDKKTDDKLFLILPSIEVIIIGVIVFILMCKLADKKRTPIFIYLAVSIAWFFGFGTIIFVPLDLYSSEKSADQV